MRFGDNVKTYKTHGIIPAGSAGFWVENGFNKGMSVVEIDKSRYEIPTEYLAPMEKSALQIQEGGDHYKNMKIQPIEYIHANKLQYMEGNVVKYISRHKSKNGKIDVLKAIHYCNLILELEYGDEK